MEVDSKEEERLSNPPPNLPAPAISVIIPMYNAEEYISECLESILEQTFQSFEVIVVDDCSTDLSCEVVERYIPKFNNRLRLYHTEKNSGGGGYVPRNIGLSFASGEYVWFVDADDFILLTALETLYNAAKRHKVEVVYMGMRYLLSGSNNVRVSRDGEGKLLSKSGLEDKIDLRIDQCKENLRRLFFEGNFHAGWTKFVQRDFLLKRRIIFPEIIRGGDYIWGIHVYCCAKRFLRLPTSLYFYRDYGDKSVTKEKKDPSEQIPLWVSAFAVWAKTFTEVSNKNEVLKNNPAYCYATLEQEFMWFFRHIIQEMRGFSIVDVYEMLYNEFAKKKDLFDATIPFLFSVVIAYKKCLLEANPYISVVEGGTECKIAPKLSVIISLYNYGKYVGACLDSLLVQSFQDFEVIVVDDCSTDNSAGVVESYILKFGGRLKFTRTEKNSGGGGKPRNIGFNFSSGKYVFFMDADDVVTKTALEEMYWSAENFDADVVYCEKYYMSEGVGQKFIYNIHLADSKIQNPPFVDKPTLETQDMAVRIQRALKLNYWVTPWLRLVRRDMLIENKIEFPVFTNSEDVIWSFKVLFCSKRFLRIPNICYIRRMHNESVSSRELTPSEYLNKHMYRTILGLKDMDDFMKRIEFFRENPKDRYNVLTQFIYSDFKKISTVCKGLEPFEVATILRQEFGGYIGSNDVLISCLCAEFSAKLQEKQLENQMFAKFKNYITARIDIKLIPKTYEADLQLLTMSEYKAKVTKPKWLQKNGIGYVVTSCAGKLEFVAKATTDGQINLDLKGVDVRDPDDKSKRIPYWIDYTKLIVNGETVFDTVTPAWHDKSFNYNLDVKADEEIVVEVEWLPHRSDTNVTEASVREKISDIERLNAEIENLSTKTAELQRNNAELAQTIDNFAPCFTARFDVQLILKESAKRKDFQITSVSDSTAKVIKAGWLPKNNVGYSINSHVGKIEFVAKASSDGLFRLELRGMDVRAPEDRSKRIPYWIDYTSLTINGETMLDKVTPVWHNKPCVYSLNMKADEEVVVQAEWAPHRNDTIASEALVREKVADIEKLSTEIENLTRKTTELQKDNADLTQTVENLSTKTTELQRDNADLTQTVENLSTKTTELQRDNADLTQTVENLSTKTTELQMTNANLAQIISNFAPYLTARIDVRLISEAEGCDLKVLSVSDDKAKVSKPIRYRKDGSGCSISSYVGNLKMVVKPNTDGQVQVTLRGKDVRKEDDRSKRIPYWIDYTALIVNEQTILDTVTPVWHNKPYRHNMEVKAGEEITIQVEWLPHRSDT